LIANEVLDAQPVHRVAVRDGRLRELCVGPDLDWVETEASPELTQYFARVGLLPPEAGVAEVNLDLPAWVRRTATRLIEAGSLLLVLDYGYLAEELFSRPQGTLLTYYHHTLGSDPLVRLGEQDISVHVDFTTLASAAHAEGLDVLGVTSQRALLRNLGLEGVQRQLRSPADQQAVAELVSSDGLGRIGALYISRRLPNYQPVGLVGREWPDPPAVPTLDEPEDDFLRQWREVFNTAR
jgi:SAM-dependent MidA family methyltransferase